jgi:hypothetical protein
MFTRIRLAADGSRAFGALPSLLTLGDLHMKKVPNGRKLAHRGMRATHGPQS